MIAVADLDRKARFRVALALRQLTAAEWGARNGVTATHVSLVLHGKRESASLTAKMDSFIAESLGQSAA